MGDAMSWMRRRLSCCPISNATEDEESIAVHNDYEWGVRGNPTPLAARAPPVKPPPPFLRGFGPLRAPAKAAAVPFFKAHPPDVP